MSVFQQFPADKTKKVVKLLHNAKVDSALNRKNVISSQTQAILSNIAQPPKSTQIVMSPSTYCKLSWNNFFYISALCCASLGTKWAGLGTQGGPGQLQLYEIWFVIY